MLTREELDQLHNTLDDFYDGLNDAFWAATTPEAKDQLHGALALITAVIDTIIRAELTMDNAVLISLTDTLKTSMKDLTDLRQQIDKIVHDVGIAATAIGAIDKALTITGKIIAL
jgi:hypothetical protein